MNNEGETAEEKLMGCAPYLQVFKAGKLIFTSAATLHVQQSEEDLPFVQVVDGTVPFNIEEVIQGDILIRCRHLTFNKQRVSMFRAAFHTGYVPPNVLRLTKSQLDGACADKRYADDFFLDLIFEKVDAEMATKHLEEQEDDEDGNPDTQNKREKGKGPVVKASSYDAMLQGDSRFWDIITTKREEQSKQKNGDPMWGPTVGRRRAGKSKETESSKQTVASKQSKEQTALSTFSIGNEFDFLPVGAAPTPAEAPKPVEKDSLMEALDALDADDVDTEEVVFDTPSSGDSASQEKPVGEVTPGATTSDSTTNTSPTPQVPDDSSAALSKELMPAPSRASSSDDIADMDALLASADEDLADMNLDDFDDVDDDLDDLEAMLKT